MIILLENKRFDGRRWIIPIAMVGRYSYSIYIFHAIIIIFIRKELYDQPFLYYPLSFFLSILTGIGLSKLIEIPFLKIRDKFFPSRTNLSLQTVPSSVSTVPLPELNEQAEIIR
jgi:peptidoglycan/LPS O-acetylase OafA/YrhL